jgi:hypothetical protein
MFSAENYPDSFGTRGAVLRCGCDWSRRFVAFTGGHSEPIDNDLVKAFGSRDVGFIGRIRPIGCGYRFRRREEKTSFVLEPW